MSELLSLPCHAHCDPLVFLMQQCQILWEWKFLTTHKSRKMYDFLSLSVDSSWYSLSPSKSPASGFHLSWRKWVKFLNPLLSRKNNSAFRLHSEDQGNFLNFFFWRFCWECGTNLPLLGLVRFSQPWLRSKGSVIACHIREGQRRYGLAEASPKGECKVCDYLDCAVSVLHKVDSIWFSKGSSRLIILNEASDVW